MVDQCACPVFCTQVPVSLDSQAPPGGTASLQMAALAELQSTAAIVQTQQGHPAATTLGGPQLYQTKTEMNGSVGEGQGMAHKFTGHCLGF